MKVLLHPTDFSVNSEQAFVIACGIARDQNAQLIVLHVVNPHECASGDLCGTTLNPTSDLHHSIWSRFDQLKSLAGNARVSFMVRLDETLDAILDVVNQEHCDLIVLTGRSHDAFFYQLHGCISEGLIRRAPCSVLMLRHFHAEQCQRSNSEGDAVTAGKQQADASDTGRELLGGRCW